MRGVGIGRGFVAWAAMCVLACGAAAYASPVTYTFENITNNNAASASTGGQFSVTISDLGGGKVSFLFKNDGPADSSITRVYFYDGALLGATMDSFTSSAGVNFAKTGPGPGHLPGGQEYGLPKSTVEFHAKAQVAVEHSGVHPGEWLNINFRLLAGVTYDDLIASINSGLSMPFSPGTDLVIGIHVQGFEGGWSESFVTSVIPLPAPVWMGLVGLAAVFVVRRRYLV